MADFEFVFASDGTLNADLALNDDGSDFLFGNSLKAEVICCLFTDRAATPGMRIVGEDRRGWWADPTLGSHLWTLQWAPRTTETLRQAERFVRESLAHLIIDGIAERIEVEATWIANTAVMQIDITIFKPKADAERFGFLWNSLH